MAKSLGKFRRPANMSLFTQTRCSLQLLILVKHITFATSAIYLDVPPNHIWIFLRTLSLLKFFFQGCVCWYLTNFRSKKPPIIQTSASSLLVSGPLSVMESEKFDVENMGVHDEQKPQIGTQASSR